MNYQPHFSENVPYFWEISFTVLASLAYKCSQLKQLKGSSLLNCVSKSFSLIKSFHKKKCCIEYINIVESHRIIVRIIWKKQTLE